MKKKKASRFLERLIVVGGLDGTRTRDPLRDSRKLLIFKWLHLISFVLKISIL